MNLKEIKNKIIPILKKHDVKKSSVFGSVARNEDNEKSDIDILVEFKGKKTLLDLMRLQFALEEKIDRKIDLLTYNSINSLLREDILKDQKNIYEEK
jgi:hypothetical protein